jgi:hypothetical protein
MSLQRFSLRALDVREREWRWGSARAARELDAGWRDDREDVVCDGVSRIARSACRTASTLGTPEPGR